MAHDGQEIVIRLFVRENSRRGALPVSAPWAELKPSAQAENQGGDEMAIDSLHTM
jgi:hypothetical protein